MRVGLWCAARSGMLPPCNVTVNWLLSMSHPHTHNIRQVCFEFCVVLLIQMALMEMKSWVSRESCSVLFTHMCVTHMSLTHMRVTLVRVTLVTDKDMSVTSMSITSMSVAPTYMLPDIHVARHTCCHVHASHASPRLYSHMLLCTRSIYLSAIYMCSMHVRYASAISIYL